MSTGSIYLWMFGAPTVVVVVSALTASAFRSRRDKLLATTGQRAVGRVLASGCDTDGLGGSTYWVMVEYPYGGALRAVKTVVASRREQEGYRIGQRVALTYAPSR
ncbi:MAG: DUF3592 domain-containing protein, partial [Streptomyces sp.]|nr:DUF3592 domain-containing protein [Streptomyces sp.]